MTGPNRLREWTRADAAILVEAWSDPEIGRWNPVPTDTGLSAAEAWIDEAGRRPPDSAVVDLAMVDEHDRVLGEVGLRISWSRRIAEVGFWIGAEHRGRGCGRQLLELASGAADARDLRGLIAVSHADNDAAIALFGSAGWLEVRAQTGQRAFVDRQI